MLFDSPRESRFFIRNNIIYHVKLVLCQKNRIICRSWLYCVRAIDIIFCEENRFLREFSRTFTYNQHYPGKCVMQFRCGVHSSRLDLLSPRPLPKTSRFTLKLEERFECQKVSPDVFQLPSYLTGDLIA